MKKRIIFYVNGIKCVVECVPKDENVFLDAISKVKGDVKAKVDCSTSNKVK